MLIVYEVGTHFANLQKKSTLGAEQRTTVRAFLFCDRPFVRRGRKKRRAGMQRNYESIGLMGGGNSCLEAALDHGPEEGD